MTEESSKKLNDYVSLFPVQEQDNTQFDVRYGYSLAVDEIERLKKLLKKWVTMEMSECHIDYKEKQWEQFCETNKL